MNDRFSQSAFEVLTRSQEAGASCLVRGIARALHVNRGQIKQVIAASKSIQLISCPNGEELVIARGVSHARLDEYVAYCREASAGVTSTRKRRAWKQAELFVCTRRRCWRTHRYMIHVCPRM